MSDKLKAFNDFKLLINSLVGAAEFLLQKFGEFYPFGGVINVINKFEIFEVASNSENPSVKELVGQLDIALNAGLDDKRFLATGVCENVSTIHPVLGKTIDAIRIIVRHSSGHQAIYFVPYLRKDASYVFREGYFQK